MANLSIPVEERNLTPDEVQALDKRRRRGQLLLTIGLQTAIVTTLVSLLFVGQDLTYSPGWCRMMAYWAAFTALLSFLSFVTGIKLRGSNNEFLSY